MLTYIMVGQLRLIRRDSGIHNPPNKKGEPMISPFTPTPSRTDLGAVAALQ